MVSEQDAGVTGAVSVSLPILMTMVSFMAVSLYNVLELTVIIFTTFKRRAGVYFWSFIVATWGIAPHTIGFIIKFFGLTSSNYLAVTLVAFGWVAMVTGQSMVLYSRLHLVIRHPNRIRWVLYMIIFNAIVCHIPVIVMAYGANSPNPAPFLPVFQPWDKAQIAVFFLQESIISIIYIYETIRMLGPGSEIKRNPLKNLLIHLILVNVLALIFDVVVLGVQYSGHYEIQTTFKAAVYSVKLKIEFSVLNRLVAVVKNKEFTRGGVTNITNNSYPFNTYDSSDATQVNTSLGSGNHGDITLQSKDTATESQGSRTSNAERGTRLSVK